MRRPERGSLRPHSQRPIGVLMTAALAQARPLPQPENGEWFQDKRLGQ